ncbi:hypothetical protein TRICI_003392 [Trichomonascus ciferrii]|uniref:Uncharacterized protein n=1 Tax=Trichomonascus ciferrii TaxID=44093 RepID=A0A642V3A7_9ASCO|nr:hypothetical protein TRICI_003392 [Trichomonascus ciferrii]
MPKSSGRKSTCVVETNGKGGLMVVKAMAMKDSTGYQLYSKDYLNPLKGYSGGARAVFLVEPSKCEHNMDTIELPQRLTVLNKEYNFPCGKLENVTHIPWAVVNMKMSEFCQKST